MWLFDTWKIDCREIRISRTGPRGMGHYSSSGNLRRTRYRRVPKRCSWALRLTSPAAIGSWTHARSPKGWRPWTVRTTVRSRTERQNDRTWNRCRTRDTWCCTVKVHTSVNANTIFVTDYEFDHKWALRSSDGLRLQSLG